MMLCCRFNQQMHIGQHIKGLKTRVALRKLPLKKGQLFGFTSLLGADVGTVVVLLTANKSDDGVASQ